jgi:small-conductance mechanosensitive channel
MDWITTFGEREWFGNTPAAYGEAVIIFIVLSLALLALRWVFLLAIFRFLRKGKTQGRASIEFIRSLHLPFYAYVALYFAARSLELSETVEKTLTAVLIVFVVYQASSTFQMFLRYLFTKNLQGREDPRAYAAAGYAGKTAAIILWLIGGLLLLSNLGINITSLLAGLGIGGIAIAFAMQSILRDLFSSFSIYFDKPFQVGDFISMGDYAGRVEKIGIKTTRLRALQGEQVVISNQDLTSKPVQNFKRMKERRVIFTFGVSRETSTGKLKELPEIVTQVFERMESVRLDRVHMTVVTDSAFEFEVVYWVLDRSYRTFMKIHEAVSVEFLTAVKKEKIELVHFGKLVSGKQL